MRWKKTLEQYFEAVRNNQCPNSGFLEIQLLHCWHESGVKNWCVKTVCNTNATKQAAVFLINGSFDETEKQDENVKRFLVLCENKEDRCSKFWNFAYTVFQSSYQTNRTFNLLEVFTFLTSKIETVHALKQNTENATEEL